MILFGLGGPHTARRRIVLLFGSGLIGGAVAQALRNAPQGARARKLAWTWPRPSASEEAAAEAETRTTLAEAGGAPDLTVIWAAGRSGFGSSDADMSLELSALDRVLSLTSALGQTHGPDQTSFFLVSSAGGLFEGQVACNGKTSPAPLRPYGLGKLRQERMVRDHPALGHRLILRPSSVYGYGRDARRGLISALIAAGLQHRPAQIFGALTTQRDYVLADDVGRYVAARVTQAVAGPTDAPVETVLLASGRPASVFEVLGMVEARIGAALHVRIDPRPQNARDNSFLPSAAPSDFVPTGLSEGIALTATRMALERYSGVPL